MFKKVITGIILTGFVVTSAYAEPEYTARDIGKVEKESALYYPVTKGNTWYFKGFKKKEPGKELKVKAELKGIEQRNNKDYAYFYAPQVDIRYLIRRGDDGVFMRVIRYPFPFFNMSIEVDLLPEMQIMKFPFVKGEKWTYKGRGEATILGFIKLGRDIKSDFEVKEKVRIKTDAGDFDAWHIQVIVDQGDGKPVTTEKYWYAKGIGYTYADTSGHIAELVGYKLYSEDGKNEVREAQPKGGGKYE